MRKHLWGQILIFSTCAAKGKGCLTKETYDNLPVAPGLLPALACWESPLAPTWLHKCCALHEEVLCYLQKSQMNIQIKPLWILRAKKIKKWDFCLWTEQPFHFKPLAWQLGFFCLFPNILAYLSHDGTCWIHLWQGIHLSLLPVKLHRKHM